jgi:hypothetical protein
MEAMMEMDEDFDDEDDLGGATSAPAPVVKTDAVERKRKRRTVKKSKMEMDDKGYMGKQISIYFVLPCPCRIIHGQLYRPWSERLLSATISSRISVLNRKEGTLGR